MTGQAGRIVVLTLLIGGFSLLYHFFGFQAAVLVWLAWYTQVFMYQVVWDDEQDD
jgi:hypothetical protein